MERTTQTPLRKAREIQSELRDRIAPKQRLHVFDSELQQSEDDKTVRLFIESSGYEDGSGYYIQVNEDLTVETSDPQMPWGYIIDEVIKPA